jgi:hypothetical protein
VELVADGGQQLHGGERGVEDHRHVDRGGQLLEQRAAERGLPRAHLAGELDEPAAALGQPPEEVRQGLAVSLGEKEIPRVRRDRERRLRQTEV